MSPRNLFVLLGDGPEAQLNGKRWSLELPKGGG
jgi:hypothetical protein